MWEIIYIFAVDLITNKIMKDLAFVGILVFVAFALILSLIFLFMGDGGKSLLWLIFAVISLYYVTIRSTNINKE